MLTARQPRNLVFRQFLVLSHPLPLISKIIKHIIVRKMTANHLKMGVESAFEMLYMSNIPQAMDSFCCNCGVLTFSFKMSEVTIIKGF
jgi:hypothetical protein